ncbi:hypothetical protein BDM02DRAFT_3113863 [Thelephora ganbajun]|uniref:Uncharacterized protein n=1 Tax=Thelephora ganbajun TaxID=370292 RepID=A0ACB6ZJ87_THEGA|nr:hypothetical protein BDM02DRAFT_3113863 [Thelephora ganbajun]
MNSNHISQLQETHSNLLYIRWYIRRFSLQSRRTHRCPREQRWISYLQCSQGKCVRFQGFERCSRVSAFHCMRPRPNVLAPLVTRFFGSVSDDEVPWDMLNQLHSFASALNSNELYQLELSMVKQILEEFQSVFEVTLTYKPEYGQIMGDLQESIKNAEAAITIIGPRNARASSNQLTSPSVTPLTHRRRYLPLPHPEQALLLPPTNNKVFLLHPNFPASPLSKKRKHMAVFVELTPWAVKKRRMFAQGTTIYPPDRPVRVVDKERQ